MHDAPPRSAVQLWAATPKEIHRARHVLVETLAAWGLGEELGDAAALVLSELLTNAMQHARVPGRSIGTRLVPRADGLRIEVHDSRGEGRPRRREAGVDEERGRGLALVDALSGGRWGVAGREGPGKVVWAELRAGRGGFGIEVRDAVAAREEKGRRQEE